MRVVHRILDLIETIPAARIARMLNDEGVPSPKAGRVRRVGGVAVPNAGLWTQNTVRNIAAHPLLIACWEYGRRGMGDQLRFTPSGPRALTDGDYPARRSAEDRREPRRGDDPIPGRLRADHPRGAPRLDPAAPRGSGQAPEGEAADARGLAQPARRPDPRPELRLADVSPRAGGGAGATSAACTRTRRRSAARTTWSGARSRPGSSWPASASGCSHRPRWRSWRRGSARWRRRSRATARPANGPRPTARGSRPSSGSSRRWGGTWPWPRRRRNGAATAGVFRELQAEAARLRAQDPESPATRGRTSSRAGGGGRDGRPGPVGGPREVGGSGLGQRTVPPARRAALSPVPRAPSAAAGRSTRSAAAS